MDAEIREALDTANAVDRPDLVVDHGQQARRVLAQDLDQQIERAGGEHDVDHSGDVSDAVGNVAHVPFDPYPERGHHRIAECQRIGDTDDLHDAGVEQSLHA